MSDISMSVLSLKDYQILNLFQICQFQSSLKKFEDIPSHLPLQKASFEHKIYVCITAQKEVTLLANFQVARKFENKLISYVKLVACGFIISIATLTRLNKRECKYA